MRTRLIGRRADTTTSGSGSGIGSGSGTSTGTVTGSGSGSGNGNGYGSGSGNVAMGAEECVEMKPVYVKTANVVVNKKVKGTDDMKALRSMEWFTHTQVCVCVCLCRGLCLTI